MGLLLSDIFSKELVLDTFPFDERDDTMLESKIDIWMIVNASNTSYTEPHRALFKLLFIIQTSIQSMYYCTYYLKANICVLVGGGSVCWETLSFRRQEVQGVGANENEDECDGMGSHH